MFIDLILSGSCNDTSGSQKVVILTSGTIVILTRKTHFHGYIQFESQPRNRQSGDFFYFYPIGCVNVATTRCELFTASAYSLFLIKS